MQIIKKQEKIANYIFFAAVMIHLAIMCVGLSAWEIPFRGRLIQLAFGLCCLKILMTYYEKEEWFCMFIAAAVAGASYACSGEKYFVYVAVLIIAAKSVDFDKILKIMLYATAVSMAVIAILSLCGIGLPASVVSDYGRGVVENRWGFGMGHANNFHGTVWYVTALLIMCFQDKLTWKHYGIMTVANIILFVLSVSKAGVIAVQLMIFAGLACKYADRFVFQKRWIYILGVIALAGILVLTYIAVSTDCWADYGPVLKKIDSVLTGRMNLAYQSAFIGDWRPLSKGGNGKYPVDNGYALMPATDGYVVATWYIIFLLVMIYKTASKKDGITYAVIMTCIFYTFMEQSYTLNDAYLLSNLCYVAAMVYFGRKQSKGLV